MKIIIDEVKQIKKWRDLQSGTVVEFITGEQCIVVDRSTTQGRKRSLVMIRGYGGCDFLMNIATYCENERFKVLGKITEIHIEGHCGVQEMVGVCQLP